MGTQALGTLPLSALAAERAQGLADALHGESVELLRLACERGALDALVGAQPDRYVEVHVGADGEAVALTRDAEYGDAVMLSIPRGAEASRARLLARFLRGEALQLA